MGTLPIRWRRDRRRRVDARLGLPHGAVRGVREGGGGAVSGSDVSSRRAARQRSLPVTTANASARRMSVVNVTPYASNLVRSRSSTSGRERGVLLRTS